MKHKPYNFSLPVDLIEKMRKYCEQHGHSLSWFVATAIKEKLARVNKSKHIK